MKARHRRRLHSFHALQPAARRAFPNTPNLPNNNARKTHLRICSSLLTCVVSSHRSEEKEKLKPPKKRGGRGGGEGPNCCWFSSTALPCACARCGLKRSDGGLAGAFAAARRGSQRRLSILRLLRQLLSSQRGAAAAFCPISTPLACARRRDVSRCAPRRAASAGLRRVGEATPVCACVCARTHTGVCLTGSRWRVDETRRAFHF